MAISSTTEKLAVMEWCQVWEPGLPFSPGTIGQDDQQQLLWGYPGVLWGEPVAGGTGQKRGGFMRSVGRMMQG